MNVLILEDRGAVATQLAEKIEQMGHTVFIAQNIPKAMGYYRTGEMHCIITDLNLSPTGLKDEEKKQTGGGILSGWIWLKNYVFPENESIKKCTIILTAYPTELHDSVPSEDLAGVTVISKSLSIEEDLKRVLQKINNISERKADMNILLLEDRGAVAIPLTEKLENLGHTVFIAQNIPKAKSFFRTEEIHCIITDLNLPPKGLKDEEKKQTGNGILSGWIWLKNYVFPENEPIKKSTIILTAYPDELHGCVPSEDLAGVTVISKSLSIEEDLKRVLESTRKIVEAENEKKG